MTMTVFQEDLRKTCLIEADFSKKKSLFISIKLEHETENTQMLFGFLVIMDFFLFSLLTEKRSDVVT